MQTVQDSRLGGARPPPPAGLRLSLAVLRSLSPYPAVPDALCSVLPLPPENPLSSPTMMLMAFFLTVCFPLSPLPFSARTARCCRPPAAPGCGAAWPPSPPGRGWGRWRWAGPACWTGTQPRTMEGACASGGQEEIHRCGRGTTGSSLSLHPTCASNHSLNLVSLLFRCPACTQPFPPFSWGVHVSYTSHR